MANFFLELVNMSITASYLIVAVVILRLVLSKAPKWIRGILWGFVGIRLVVPFSFESMFSLMPDSSLISMQNSNVATGTDAGALPEGLDFSMGVEATLQGIEVTGVDAPAVEISSLGDASFITVIAIVWLIGLVAMLVYCAVSYLRLHRRMSDAVIYRGGKYAVYQSEKVASPFVLGFFAPKIYLPYKMDAADMDCVIAHEKAHIARKDHWIKPVAFIILAVYWFNPLVWLAYILLCRDIELACDEKVIKEMGVENKKRYSEALLKCSVPERMISACPLAFGEVGVKKRIVNVLNYKKPAFWIIIVSLILCAVVAVCFLTNPKETTPYSDDESVDLVNVAEEGPESFETNTSVQTLKSPPTMTLQDSLSSTLNFLDVESGTYSWSYSADSSGEMVSMEASGAFPTVAVKGKEDEWIQVRDYNGIDYAPYHASFDVDPDRLRIREYDLLELGDMEPEVLAEYTLEDVYFMELRPRRIYEVTAEWDEDSHKDFYGEATYIFATDNYAINDTEMEGEEQAVIIQATIKETMPDTADKICISSDTADFPGAFVVRIPEDVYNKDTLQGGQQIMLSMKDTGEMYDEHLPLYEALVIRVRPVDEANTSGEGGTTSRINLLAVVDTPWEYEVNTLDGVDLVMEKYSATGGDLEIVNQFGKELEGGQWFTIQREIEGKWYNLDYLYDTIAFEDIAYILPDDETTILPITWEWIYGELPEGEYRVVTKVHDYRAPGDFDVYYLAEEFEIK